MFQFHDLHVATRPTVLAGLLGYSAVMVVLLFDLGAGIASTTCSCTRM
ncbi:MAG: hypothetical protein U0521_04380 [Anaerolineae bacterium]